MQTFIRLTLCSSRAAFVLAVLVLGLATLAPTPAQARSDETSTADLAINDLVTEVQTIASAHGLSHARKEIRIAQAVRVAVVAATAYTSDPQEIVARALRAAESAIRVAPAYTEVIKKAVAFTPSVARVDGASTRVKTLTVSAGPPLPANPPAAYASAYADAQSSSTGETPAEMNRPTAPAITPIVSPSREDGEPIAGPYRNATGAKLSPGLNVHATAEVSLDRDDNVFLVKNAPTADTILTATPGVSLGAGTAPNANWQLGYRQSFQHYLSHSVPDTSLGAANGNFGFDDGRTLLAAVGSFQQLNQNNADVAFLGKNALYRRDVADTSLLAEFRWSDKTTIVVGNTFDRTQYKSAGLSGDRAFAWPLKVYWGTSPKFNVGLGATYRTDAPQLSGPTAHDLFYNVDARGEFTPKLTGQLSVGYWTRSLPVSPRQNLWGFDGSFLYQATEKTKATLALSRNFGIGTQGQSVRQQNYQLNLESITSPRLSLGASLIYAAKTYGTTLFLPAGSVSVPSYDSHYWEMQVYAAYRFNEWVNARLSYSARQNATSDSIADFNDHLFSLSWIFQY